MMKNYGESVEINHNLTWPYIPHYLYRILINCGLRSGKNNVLLNVLYVENQQPDVHKMYLYVKDPFEWKYQLLINRTKKVKKLKNPRAFITYSQTIDVNKNLENYSPKKKANLLIVFGYVIPDI